VSLGLSDATVLRKRDWDAWLADNAGKARVLSQLGPVPGGFSVAVKKDLPAEQRARLAKWFGSAATTCGMKNLSAMPDCRQFERVAQLGSFTPMPCRAPAW
jgi:ABC-type phosphate/phosphonate transport system substrate-binding protein